nr:MAG TPA: hypothetical protein [Caudoviricetes sp.]
MRGFLYLEVLFRYSAYRRLKFFRTSKKRDSLRNLFLFYMTIELFFQVVE